MDKTHREHIRRIRFGCLILVAALAAGAWANWPYLSAEHRRWEFWQLVGLYFSDLAALFWFLRFAFVHAVQGRPVASLPVNESRRQFNRVAATIFSALLIDLVFTFYLMEGRLRWPTKSKALIVHALSR